MSRNLFPVVPDVTDPIYIQVDFMRVFFEMFELLQSSCSYDQLVKVSERSGFSMDMFITELVASIDENLFDFMADHDNEELLYELVSRHAATFSRYDSNILSDLIDYLIDNDVNEGVIENYLRSCPKLSYLENNCGNRPLQIAVMYGALGYGMKLLQHGAFEHLDRSKNWYQVDTQLASPLFYALANAIDAMNDVEDESVSSWLDFALILMVLGARLDIVETIEGSELQPMRVIDLLRSNQALLIRLIERSRLNDWVAMFMEDIMPHLPNVNPQALQSPRVNFIANNNMLIGPVCFDHHGKPVVGEPFRVVNEALDTAYIQHLEQLQLTYQTQHPDGFAAGLFRQDQQQAVAMDTIPEVIVSSDDQVVPVWSPGGI